MRVKLVLIGITAGIAKIQKSQKLEGFNLDWSKKSQSDLEEFSVYQSEISEKNFPC
jgi:hypothetical protein